MTGFQNFEAKKPKVALLVPDILGRRLTGVSYNALQGEFYQFRLVLLQPGWPGKQKPLQQVRFRLQGDMSLCAVFDAFQKYEASALANHFHQALQQNSRAAVVLCIYQQAAVEFDDQWVDAPKTLEIGIAHTEIVNGNLETVGLGFQDEFQQCCRIVGCCLHQFQNHFFWIDSAALALQRQLFQGGFWMNAGAGIYIEEQPHGL